MLLSAKPALHEFSRRSRQDDVIATVKFLLVRGGAAAAGPTSARRTEMTRSSSG